MRRPSGGAAVSSPAQNVGTQWLRDITLGTTKTPVANYGYGRMDKPPTSTPYSHSPSIRLDSNVITHMRITDNKMFKGITLVFGVLPALLLDVGIVIIFLFRFDDIVHHPVQNLKYWFPGIGAILGTLGFFLAVLFDKAWPRLTVFLMACGLLTVVYLFFVPILSGGALRIKDIPLVTTILSCTFTAVYVVIIMVNQLREENSG
jgi:hypothetical protein